MEYMCLIDKLPKYYEKMARTDFTTVFSNIWWALRGPDIIGFEDHKWVYTIPIRAAMLGFTGSYFNLYVLCPSLETYVDFIEEVLTLRDANDLVVSAMRHYLDHTLRALAWLEDLFEGTDVGKIFSILADVANKELMFIGVYSFGAFRDMVKKLKKITIICQNCKYAEYTKRINTIRCKKDGERHSIVYWCECFEPRLD